MIILISFQSTIKILLLKAIFHKINHIEDLLTFLFQSGAVTYEFDK